MNILKLLYENYNSEKNCNSTIHWARSKSIPKKWEKKLYIDYFNTIVNKRFLVYLWYVYFTIFALKYIFFKCQILIRIEL